MASILLMKLKNIYVVPSRKHFVEEDEDVSDDRIFMDLSDDIAGDESFNAAVIEINLAQHESSVNTANSLSLQILGMQPSAETSNITDESDLSDEAKSALDTLKSIIDRKETRQEERDELTHLASVAGCFLASVAVVSVQLISVLSLNETNLLAHLEQLDDFKPPKELVNSCPYYISGFDHEKRPVLIVEIGKCPIRKTV
ncbi:unnamed protein product, partial [Allacma fusca]